MNEEQDIIKMKPDVCPDCRKHHTIDFDFEQMVEGFTDEFFPDVWAERKHEMKEMSKKEVAEQMYYLGALHFVQTLDQTMAEFEELIEKKRKNRKS